MEVSHHLSAVLVADFAASVREALAAITDPAERCAREQEFLQTLTRVRRQDCLAGKLALERERRERELAGQRENDEDRKKLAKEWEPIHRQFKRSFMADSYAKPDLASQLLGTLDAESLLRDVKLDGSGPDGSTAPLEPQSN